ncbi:hypothetical protein HanPSC8_Chr05g0214221 [Helianthus annuus]|nr:hypothetical protein HanPSC8_Chr05g0214221 [Helianthus annuus]
MNQLFQTKLFLMNLFVCLFGFINIYIYIYLYILEESLENRTLLLKERFKNKKV